MGASGRPPGGRPHRREAPFFSLFTAQGPSGPSCVKSEDFPEALRTNQAQREATEGPEGGPEGPEGGPEGPEAGLRGLRGRPNNCLTAQGPSGEGLIRTLFYRGLLGLLGRGLLGLG